MNLLIPVIALLLAAALAFFANWHALGPWRQNRDKHWTEQARLVFPVLAASRSNQLMIPAVFVLVTLLIWPDSFPLWLLVGTAALLGAYAGQLPAVLEVFPRFRFGNLLADGLIELLLRFVVWITFITMAVVMPHEFDGLAVYLGLCMVVMGVAWSRIAMILVRALGLIQPAPDRLRVIADATSAKTGIAFREVLLIRAPIAQAIALIPSRRILFTERLLEIMSDDEVAAVCAHELAHLTESRSNRTSRSIRQLMLFPWIYFNPVLHTFGIFGFYGLVLITYLVPKLYHRVSQKLEVRADQIAKTNEGDAGTYARALAKLYEDNLTPAVYPRKRSTHPHLYDRLLAAGVTPDYPRPAPGKAFAWHGSIMAVLAGGLFAIFAIRLLHVSAVG